MNGSELMTIRWNVIQQARLQEMQALMENVAPEGHLELIEALNADAWWEHIFDQMEDALRVIDPNHEYLPENHIPVG